MGADVLGGFGSRRGRLGRRVEPLGADGPRSDIGFADDRPLAYSIHLPIDPLARLSESTLLE